MYFAFDNPRLKMITSGAWEIGMYPHLPERYLPKDVAHQFFIEFNNDILHGEIVIKMNEYFLFIHRKTTPIKNKNDFVYKTKHDGRWNTRVGIYSQKDSLSQLIVLFISENRVFYSDNESGEILRNYILWEKSYSVIGG